MKASIEGRLNNIRLPKKSCVMPLFEAVVNSIDSLKEVKADVDKRIDIEVIRDLSQPSFQFKDNDNYLADPVIGFKVHDNGVGFTEDNFDSFCTFDSQQKLSLGGKGIGRLIWLKAFSTVKIDSIFETNGHFHRISFDFVPFNDGIDNKREESLDNHQQCKTTISLLDFKDDYRINCPKNLIDIAFHIIEHCLIFFLFDECPKIVISDSISTLSLNDIFNERFKDNVRNESIKLDNEEFDIFHIKHHDKLAALPIPRHRIVYCAHKRVVKTDYLDAYVTDLKRKLQDKDGKGYMYSAFVTGNYLDKYVNADRTDFIFMEDNNLFSDNIIKNIVETSARYLKEDLVPVQESKFEEYAKYITHKAPQYRVILKHYSEEIKKMPPGLDEQKLNQELYRIKTEITLKVREKGEKLLKKPIKRIQDIEDYKIEYNKYLEEENDIGKSNLAEYVSHRKIILELFKNLLNIKNKKYSPEEDVHKIIYPLKATSEDVDWEDQNLWIIDERLSYHNYLASDMPLNHFFNIESLDRPDIVIYSTHLFVDDLNKPYSSIFLIEFKKPGPIKKKRDENPIEQLYRYVKDIREGKAKDKNGRPISASAEAAFYGYIICDLDDKLHAYARDADYSSTPDGLGYFGYNKNHKIYVEIIPFDKLLQDAQKRNKILFDKLNLV